MKTIILSIFVSTAAFAADFNNATCTLELVPARLSTHVIDKAQYVKLVNSKPLELIDGVNGYKVEISRTINEAGVENNGIHMNVADSINGGSLGNSSGGFEETGFSITVPTLEGRKAIPGESRFAEYLRVSCF